MERPEFELKEQVVTIGRVEQPVLDELVRLKEEARVAAKDYRDAIEAQAKRHKIRKKALAAFVAAHAGDKVHELRNDTESLATLLA